MFKKISQYKTTACIYNYNNRDKKYSPKQSNWKNYLNSKEKNNIGLRKNEKKQSLLEGLNLDPSEISQYEKSKRWDLVHP